MMAQRITEDMVGHTNELSPLDAEGINQMYALTLAASPPPHPPRPPPPPAPALAPP